MTTDGYKAGGIKLLDNPDEAAESAGQILGKNMRGIAVTKLLVEEKLWFVSQARAMFMTFRASIL